MADSKKAARYLKLASLARSQHGLVTRQQVLGAGFSEATADRLTASGQWQRLERGVWRQTSSPVTWRQLVLAAVLAAGDGAVASHRTAARLWALDGWQGAAVPLELTVMVGSGFHRPGVVAYQSRRGGRARARLHAIPTTGLGRTVIDLAAVLTPRRLESALDCALRLQPWLHGVLERALRQAGNLRGSATLRALLQARREPTDSELEILVERELRAALLWDCAMHHLIRGPSGVVASVDFAWLRERVAVQCHGFKYHGQQPRWQLDQQQTRELLALGWVVVPITWKDITKAPGRTMSALKAVLNRRSTST